MAQTKKFDLRVQQGDQDWSAEIIRRVTSKKTMVSKSQAGFATEAEARQWGEQELKQFLEHQVERNKRHARKRLGDR